VYRTGDRARWGADGTLEFLGRLDRQLKLRGYRIEPGEIESVLTRHPAVRQAVISVRGQGLDRRLVAYVVPCAGVAIPLAELRSQLRQWLPEYMVPAAVVVLEALPQTANGKLDEGRLPAPGLADLNRQPSTCPAPTPLHDSLCRIWAEVLGLPTVGIHDNFFDLGGHSLLGVKLFARLEQALGHRLALPLLFHAPTVAQLAQTLQDNRGLQGGPIVPIRPTGGKCPLFFVHSKNGTVWYGHQIGSRLDSEQPVFGIAQPLRPDGQVRLFTRMEEMAECYVEALCDFAPTGPVSLAGFSFSGMVVYEMARQLQARGKQVNHLVIIDTGPGGYSLDRRRPGPFRWMREALYNLPYWALDDLFQTRFDQMLARIPLKLHRVFQSARRWWSGIRALDSGAEERPSSPATSSPDQQATAGNLRLLRDYLPGPYPGRITLLRARAFPLLGPFPADLGWGALAQGGVDLRIVPGRHWTLTDEPFLSALVQQLQMALDQS
jgi:thioesterase domain-containing protein